ncbi:MAG TPA: hypothetical protein PLA19_02525 [Candidatus Pacearchaeota archaeon]|nr:hypothetical protein [Candidatus Pacearchaeota archaeon]
MKDYNNNIMMSKSVIFIVSIVSIAALVAVGWYYWLNNNQNEALIRENPQNKNIAIENTQELPANNDNPQESTEKQPIASQVKEEESQPVDQTYSYITNCNQACTAIGYNGGYCGDWIENNDNTISECANRQEYPFFQSYYDGMKLNDCQFAGDIDAKKKVICCCKGEPQNPSGCPAMQRPSEPMDCIEQPGYLKNSKTGICCWYRATCYGPQGDGWAEYRTKAECLAK